MGVPWQRQGASPSLPAAKGTWHRDTGTNRPEQRSVCAPAPRTPTAGAAGLWTLRGRGAGSSSARPGAQNGPGPTATLTSGRTRQGCRPASCTPPRGPAKEERRHGRPAALPPSSPQPPRRRGPTCSRTVPGPTRTVTRRPLGANTDTAAPPPPAAAIFPCRASPARLGRSRPGAGLLRARPGRTGAQ